MPFIILLLIAILIVLIGGPMALGYTVALPAILASVGISPALPILFWIVVAVAGSALVALSIVFLAGVSARAGFRKCPECETPSNPDHQFCQKCMHDFGGATPMQMPTRDLKF